MTICDLYQMHRKSWQLYTINDKTNKVKNNHYFPLYTCPKTNNVQNKVLPWDLFTKFASYYCWYACLSGTSSKVNGGLFKLL